MKLKLGGLIGVLAIAFVLGLSAPQLAAGLSMQVPSSPNSLVLTLPLIGVAIFIVTLPIRRYRKAIETVADKKLPRPNPFQSYRLMILASAVLIAGLGFLGWHLGLLIWVYGFSVAAAAVVQQATFGAVGSFVMALGGYLAQNNCKTPKDPEGEPS